MHFIVIYLKHQLHLKIQDFILIDKLLFLLFIILITILLLHFDIIYSKFNIINYLMLFKQLLRFLILIWPIKFTISLRINKHHSLLYFSFILTLLLKKNKPILINFIVKLYPFF